jgi:cellulose synthase/poly-beta-1,6-N-acetylglucosamine synthase-like glycosyltransferase
VVCGRLVLIDAATGRNADGVYWRYETFLKRCEARLGALLGANGAIYAIRRRLLPSIPDNVLVDDFVIPLLARLNSGCRIVYDADAIAREETAPDVGSEFRRRSRIGAGGFQALGVLGPLLHPRWGWTSLAFWSHKVLRWTGPVFLLGALFISVLLVRQPLYFAMALAQVAVYALSAFVAILPGTSRPMRLLRVLPMFVGMNLALLVGLLRWIRGRQTGVWTRTPRTVGTNTAPSAQ